MKTVHQFFISQMAVFRFCFEFLQKNGAILKHQALAPILLTEIQSSLGTLRTGAIRVGNGDNAIEWMPVHFYLSKNNFLIITTTHFKTAFYEKYN